MKIRQIAQSLFVYIHFSYFSVIALMLTLFSVTAYTQQYDCSQPGGCSIMVTDYSGSVVYADTYFGPNYSLNRTYTGETYTFDIMPVFTGVDVAIYWPSTDWGNCDEIGVFYSVTPNEGVTTQTWGGSPHMYLDATFPGSGSWTLTAGHDGWSCQQLHCGTTVNGCEDYMSVTLTSGPAPTPTITPTFTPTPTRTPTLTPTPIGTPTVSPYLTMHFVPRMDCPQYYSQWINPYCSTCDYYGHGMFKIWTDNVPYFSDLQDELNVINGKYYGLYPTTEGLWRVFTFSPGRIQENDHGDHCEIGKIYFTTQPNDFRNAVDFLTERIANPPSYNALLYNCVDFTQHAASSMNISLPYTDYYIWNYWVSLPQRMGFEMFSSGTYLTF